MGKHRYKIQDVHERTGLARRTISTLYNDKATRIDFSTVEKLCQLFDCGIEQLLSLSDEHPQQLQIDLKEKM
jgi:putative transcriptional regulator